MKRRTLLTLGAGVAASMLTGLRPAVADLEPDGQWLIYRRYSLLIVGQRDNEIARRVRRGDRRCARALSARFACPVGPRS